MKSPHFTPLLLLVLLSSAIADDELFFADLPVVASVSRLPQRLADAPASVTVIDREMIRASGVRSLNDIFRLVPGFQTFAHSDTASRVNYHGITDDNDFSPRVQVLVDGRSLHSPLFRNGMNWALVPVALEDIERIEVVRGSNSVSYGTNAFLGVVNIITIDPSLVQGSSVSASSGSQGVRDYTLRTGGHIGDNGSFRLTYQETKDDGLEDDYDWRDSYRNRRLDLRVNYAASVRDSLELHLGRVDGKFTRGRLDTVTPPVVDTRNPFRDLDESSLWIQARWLRSLGDGADVSLRYTFNEDKGDDFFIDPTRPQGYKEVNESGDWGRRHEMEAVHNFSPIEKVRLVWGASWRHDAVGSKTMLRGRGIETRQVWRAFANSEWKPSYWITANLGASSEYDTLAGNHLSPRASLAFHMNTENTVRVGYVQAWRTSSVFAYQANYLAGPAANQVRRTGNPQLPAERLDSWELAYLGDWRDWRMSLDVRHFREKVSDRLMIVRPVASPGPSSEQSIQDITMRGYEVQFKWQPVETTRLLFNHSSIRIDAELSATGALIAATPGSNLFAGVDLYTLLAEKSAPRRSSSVLLMQKLPFGFDLSLARYWVGDMRWTRNTSADKYARTDARLAYSFAMPSVGKGELAYTVQSLNGSHAEQRGIRRDESAARQADDFLKRRNVGRRHWVTLNLNF